MRTFDRTILRTLSIALAGGGFVIACTSSNPVDPGSDGGLDDGAVSETGPLPDGALPDNIAPQGCTKDEECASGVCNLATKTCAPSNCKDGTKNATETDIDCGGDCPKCDTNKICKVAADCASGVCKDTGTGLKCQAPTNTDGVKNGLETGIDCGGAGNPKCANGQGCKGRDDCDSDYCKAGICTAIVPGDGVQNGNETDVDCGGIGNARCDDNLKCLVADDCKSSVCTDLGGGPTCQPPSYTDGVKNGTETDVDCGGDPTMTYACAAEKTCLVNGDCASGGCNYAFKCAAGRSCTRRYGGDTCGLGGAGGVGPEQWEDCCKTIPVDTANGGLVYANKYQVTSGRMRAFLEDVGYDVRAFVQQARADGKIPNVPEHVNLTAYAPGTEVPVLSSDWDLYLPTGFGVTAGAGEINTDGAQNCTGAGGAPPCSEGPAQAGIYTAIRNHLGGTIFKNNSQTSTGCYVGAPGTHSFRFPDGMQDGDPPAQPEELYDTKTLNCVDYLVAQAFCVWDGGRLETFSEWQAMWGASALPWGAGPTPVTIGSASYWGCRFPWATDVDQSQCGLPHWAAYGGQPDDGRSNEYANYKYSYEYPKLAGADYIVFLTAPGRTKGRGELGHADVIGAGFELTSSVNAAAGQDPFAGRHRWAGNGSWEVHNYSKSYGGNTMLLNKYGKLGLRCVRFQPD